MVEIAGVLLIEEDRIKDEHTSLERSALEMANSIQGEVDYMALGEFLIKIKKARNQWKQVVTPVVKAGHEAHQKALALQREIDAPLERAENRIIKPALAEYDKKKEDERKREQDRVNAALRAEAEAKRKADDEERKKNELILPDSVKQEPPKPAPIPVFSQVIIPKQESPQGVSFYNQYSVEVNDLVALLQGIIEGKIPAESVLPNTSFLNRRAQVLKEAMRWPGITVKCERKVRAGGIIR